MNQYKSITIMSVIFVYFTGNPASAQPEFTYLTEFEAKEPLAIAADVNGGIYYTYFTFAGENLSKVYYVADPLGQNNIENHIPIINDDYSPAGRGWTGVAVDDTGAVYATLETGSGDDNEVRKLSPAPEFDVIQEFDIYGLGSRYNSVAWIARDEQGRGYLSVTTFSTCEIWDAANGDLITVADGGQTYQRDSIYNPQTGDIYISTNRDRSDDGLSQFSVNRWSGGSSVEIMGYAEQIESGLVPVGAHRGTYGVNGQLIGFDFAHGLIMVPDLDTESETVGTLAFYDPASPDFPVLTLDAADSPNGPFGQPADAVAVESNGETLIFVTEPALNRIVVFTTSIASVENYMLY